jgi:hypothetical protein
MLLLLQKRSLVFIKSQRKRSRCFPAHRAALRSAKSLSTTLRTISALRTVCRNINPGHRHLSILLWPSNIHNNRMPLAFKTRVRKPITFPAITMESQATSQRTARIQGSTTPITQEPSHCNSSNLRVRAIVWMPRRVRVRRRRRDVCSTPKQVQF